VNGIPENEMNMPLHIDIILPVYNRAMQLSQAVASVIDQSYKHWDLWIVDDGSTDSTAQVVQEYSTIQQIHSLHTPHRGVSHARNYGCLQGQHPWVAFLDSDDLWHTDKLAMQIEFIRHHRSMRILQTREHWIRHGKRVNPPARLEKKSRDFFTASLQDCMITPSSVILKRSLLRQNLGFDPVFPACEDYDLWLRLTCKHEVGLVDDHLMTRYGGHNDQLSARYAQMDRFRILSLLRLLKAESIDHSMWEQFITLASDETPSADSLLHSKAILNLQQQHPITIERKTQGIEVLQKKWEILVRGAEKHKNQKMLDFCTKVQTLL